MIRTVLSLYIAFTFFGASLAYAAPAEHGLSLSQSAPAQQVADTEEKATELTCAPPAAYDDFVSADWAYVIRDENSSTYLRMDTVKHTHAGDTTISCGDIKKTYTKHGLTNIYHTLKATDSTDDGSLDLLREIDYAIMHVSYRQQDAVISHRLHQTTFYNKSGNPLITFDFDDIALQTGAHLTWTPVTSRMEEEIAIFCRLANG